jgi:hypothetical protein
VTSTRTSLPAVFAQPIVSRARPELLHSHFIPTIGRLRKRAGKVVSEEEQLRLEAKAEAQEGEVLVRDEFSVLCRDLYALYPLLIRYVDNNRSAPPQPAPTCALSLILVSLTPLDPPSPFCPSPPWLDKIQPPWVCMLWLLGKASA